MNNEIEAILVIAPSVVKAGELFEVGIKVLTSPYEVNALASWDRKITSLEGPYNHSPRGLNYMDNVPKWSGILKLYAKNGYDGPTEIRFGEKASVNDIEFHGKRPAFKIKEVKFSKPGFTSICMHDVKSGIKGTSNAIYVTDSASSEKLFWGDIHVHSFLTDGLRCPEELYNFARDEAFLDFCALTEHSEGLTDSQWSYIANVTNNYNTPGSFATLIGGEWTNMTCGHRNYYFKGNSGPILRSSDPQYAKLEQLYTAAGQYNALLIPHHPANTIMGVDWSAGHDAEHERLVEIYSIWGNSERSAAEGNPFPIRFCKGEKRGQHVIDAMRQGYRLGYIGSGDIHDGRPGDSLSANQKHDESYKLTWPQGLVGLWAKELTRENIFDALWNRRVYATTGQRTWLEFSINNSPMGSCIRTDEPLCIKTKVAGTSKLKNVEIIAGEQTIQSYMTDKITLDWEVNLSSVEKTKYYYIRVTQQDGKMAWSSPIWVSPCNEK